MPIRLDPAHLYHIGLDMSISPMACPMNQELDGLLVAGRAEGHEMGLTICNQYGAPLSVGIMFWSPDTCGGDGGNWQVMGWYNFDPGTCGVVYDNDLEDVNRYWYYYALAEDGAFWAGNIGITEVPVAAFNICWLLGSVTEEGENSQGVGFRELDVNGNDDVTLNLIA